jgi:hypothetical protein
VTGGYSASRSVRRAAAPIGQRQQTPAGPGEEANSTVAESFSIKALVGHAALTVSGHLRRRPDPACESALRAAFAELDAELAEILGDRSRPGLLR